MNAPTLSICIPTYNRRAYLGELLDTLLPQLEVAQPGEVELLISDNRSTDATADYLRELAVPALRWWTNPENIGGDRNFLKLVAAARGDYVWLLGDDELLLPGALKRVLAVVRKGQVGLLIAGEREGAAADYASYRDCVRAERRTRREFPIDHTLISANVFRRELFDLDFARRQLKTSYAHMFALMGRLGDKPVTVMSELVRIRAVRPEFAKYPSFLCLKHAWYLRFLARQFDLPELRLLALRKAVNLPMEFGSRLKFHLGKLHARLGDFWWYSLLLFMALRCGDVINAVIGLWLVPRYVPDAELGAVLPLLQFSSFLGFPLVALMTIFSQRLSQAEARGERGQVKSALRWFLALSGGLALASCGAALLAMPHFFERIRVADGSLGLLILATGVAGALSPVFMRALQGLGKFRTITAVNLLSSPIRLVTMLLALPIRALSGYMLGQFVPQLLCIGAAAMALRRSEDRSIKAVPFWRGELGPLLRYSLLVFASYGAGALLAFVIPLIIRQRLSAADSAAYYMLSRFAELATYAGVTLAFIMFPLASAAKARGERPVKYYLQTVSGTLGFGLMAALALYWGGDALMAALPTAAPYIGHSGELAVLAFTLALTQACGSFTDYEFACGRYRFLIWSIPLVLLQAFFLVAFTGYTFFEDILPAVVVGWMGSLNVASLNGIIGSLLFFASLRALAIALTLGSRRGTRL